METTDAAVYSFCLDCASLLNDEAHKQTCVKEGHVTFETLLNHSKKKGIYPMPSTFVEGLLEKDPVVSQEWVSLVQNETTGNSLCVPRAQLDLKEIYLATAMKELNSQLLREGQRCTQLLDFVKKLTPLIKLIADNCVIMDPAYDPAFADHSQDELVGYMKEDAQEDPKDWAVKAEALKAFKDDLTMSYEKTFDKFRVQTIQSNTMYQTASVKKLNPVQPASKKQALDSNDGEDQNSDINPNQVPDFLEYSSRQNRSEESTGNCDDVPMAMLGSNSQFDTHCKYNPFTERLFLKQEMALMKEELSKRIKEAETYFKRVQWKVLLLIQQSEEEEDSKLDISIKQLIFEKYKEEAAKPSAPTTFRIKEAFDQLMQRANIQELINFARADQIERNLHTLEIQNQSHLMSECVADHEDEFQQLSNLEQMKHLHELGHKYSELAGKENLTNILKLLLSQEQ